MSNRPLEAIILAGGLGTRLRPVVENIPKPMAPINGRPFLEILLHKLIRMGFAKVIIATGYLSENIERYFGNSFEGIQVEYSKEYIALGTGGATRQALGTCVSDHVYVFNGDTYVDFSVEKAEDLWHKTNEPIILVSPRERVERYGTVVMDGQRIVDFDAKGVGGDQLYINAGVYILPKNCLASGFDDEAFSLESDYFHLLVKERSLWGLFTNGFFMDIGVPEDYRRFIDLDLRGLIP